MTRAEFEGGWLILKGAGLPTSAETDSDVCYAALSDIDSRVWGLAVRKAVKECAFFPTPFSLREIAGGLLIEQARAQHVHPADRQLMGRAPVEFRSGHPDLPKTEGEGFCEYLERLSIFLGYKTGTNTDDPQREAELAEAMRRDAERAREDWTDR